jgi:hypothetical protein
MDKINHNSKSYIYFFAFTSHFILFLWISLIEPKLLGFRFLSENSEVRRSPSEPTPSPCPVRIAYSWEFSPQCNNNKSKAYMACTPDGYVYGFSSYFSQADACNALKTKNLKKIFFVGDSFVRHAYEAFLNILTGNFLTGAYDFNTQVPLMCHADGQFEESTCRHYVSGGKLVCDDSIEVSLSYGAWPRISYLLPQRPDIIVWGVGNHPIDGNYSTRHGVYNASVVSSEVLLPMCHDELIRDMLRKTKVLWLLQHFRLIDFHEDESVESVRTYNLQTCKVMRDQCAIKSVDVWTPTFLLSQMKVAKNLTWDGVHWSRTVNILKAHIILSEIFDVPLHNGR